MVKKRTKSPRKLAKSDRFSLIDRELRKLTKADLIAMILAIAKEQSVVVRELEDRLNVEKPFMPMYRRDSRCLSNWAISRMRNRLLSS